MISAAMIVKNESKNLGRCLKSIKGIVDEIVVVDTGSNDDTVVIAESFGAKIFHEPWENNFAKHRNTSLSHCTGDWILQIDADEEFFLEEGVTVEALKFALSQVQPEINGVAMTLRDWSDAIQTYAGEVDIPRLFRAGQVTFKRKIHNEPMYSGITGFFSKCWLKHYGYNLSPEEQLEKAKRTIGLLKEAIAEDPEDHTLYFYLAQATLKFENNSDSALEYALEYFKRKEKAGIGFNSSIIHMIASIYIRKTQYKIAGKYITDGLKEFPKNVDLAWDLMSLGIATKNNQVTLAGAANYVRAMEAFNKSRSESGMIGNQFYFHIDPHSQAAANYWFAILQIDIGVSVMRNLTKFTKKNCAPNVHDEIESRMKEDFERLGIVDKLSSRIIVPGVFGNGNRGNNPMGLKRQSR